jgi:hypothetical protein
VETDKHGGGKLSLMNPETVLFDEDKNGNPIDTHPKLTQSQQYLWQLRMTGIQKTLELADGCEIMVIDLGDETQGVKHPAALVTTRESDQLTIADYNMWPWFSCPNVKYIRQVVGTEAHNFGQGSSELALARTWKERYPGLDIKPFYHGLLTYNGIDIDCAHHGPGVGSRNWLAGNVARFYLRDLMQRDIMEGHKPPDLVFRGHYHNKCHEVLETGNYRSELYVVPSFTMLGDHANQVMQSPSTITNGFMAVAIEDGKITDTECYYETQDVRTREEL